MIIKPNINDGETHEQAVLRCVESTWRSNPILLFEAVKDAVARADFANALVLAVELDRQKGLPLKPAQPTMLIPIGKGALDGPERCPCCDKRLHPDPTVHNIYEERALLARGTGRRNEEEKASTAEAQRAQSRTDEGATG